MQNSWSNSYYYSPQFTQDPPLQINSAPGGDITLTITTPPISSRLALRKGLAANEYQWYKNNISIAGANSNSYIIVNAQESDSGIYHCEITNTDINGLVIKRENITLNIDATMSLINNEIEDMFFLYPNPAKDILNISSQGLIVNAKISVYDALGKFIIETKISNKEDYLDVSNLNTGVYFIKIKTNENEMIKRFVKL